MTIWTQPIALIAVLAAAQAAPQAVAAAPAEAPVMAGAAAVKITPPLGVPLAGYYHERGSTGVHDDLHAKALVLEAGGTAAALVALDLIATQRGFVEEARKRIEAVLGIPGSHVMISATHAHTGPVLPSPSRRSADLGGAHPLAVKYIEELPGRILEAVTEAHRRRAPARVLHAAGRAEGLAFNRRFHMQDGTVGWNPGKLNPGILRPAGPVDAEAPLVVCEAPGGKPVAAYVNFAMHLDTVGGLEVSADYPHTLSALLAAARGEGLVTLFTIGTAGDLNHINVAWADGQKGHGEAARIGTILAAETLRAWERLELAAPGPLWA
ncbi:MAG: hypothetical protein HY721_28315, partial [Planctomycetes bacterium]|nr:hypothetical protein [Planctomycetota bacterium]